MDYKEAEQILAETMNEIDSASRQRAAPVMAFILIDIARSLNRIAEVLEGKYL